MRLRLSRWFIERQFRMNYRAALTGLLAARTQATEEEVPGWPLGTPGQRFTNWPKSAARFTELMLQRIL